LTDSKQAGLTIKIMFGVLMIFSVILGILRFLGILHISMLIVISPVLTGIGYIFLLLVIGLYVKSRSK